MAVNVSRLRSMGLAKESTIGVPVITPTRFMNAVPPDSFTPMIEPLLSKGIESVRDMYPKITQGPGTLNNMKVKLEVEPENIGEILQALTGLDAKTGANPYNHVFTPQQVSQLPSYTWWADKKPKYPLYAGCMLSKLTFDLKAGGIMECDSDWTGITYDDVDGVTEATSYSPLNPFVWSNAAVSIDGSQAFGYKSFKISFNNMVKADHALNNSIWPYVVYSDGLEIEVSAELLFENATQSQKFLNSQTANLSLTLTSGQTIPATGTKYSLTISVPAWYYKSANLIIPSDGPMTIPFTGIAQYIPGNGYSAQMTLVNGVSSQY